MDFVFCKLGISHLSFVQLPKREKKNEMKESKRVKLKLIQAVEQQAVKQ